MNEIDDGGFVYARAESIDYEGYPGITRRNKLIDDLVVAQMQAYITYGNQDINVTTIIKESIKTADATIAESNK